MGPAHSLPMRLSRLAALAALVLVPTLASAQISVTPRGDAATLDVATWNLEFFGEPNEGPNDALQLDRVEAVLSLAQIDVWGLQEVVDETEWTDLLGRIADDGYAGVLGPQVSSNPTFDQKLAFVYNTSVLSNVTTATILQGNEFAFAGRLPFELRATVTVGGTTEDVRFIVFHAKASGDSDSYSRRVAAAQALKAYTDGLTAQGVALVILGDFNDELARSTSSGSPASPYAAFVADPTYSAATLSTEQAGLATFCGSSSTCSGSSTIDHVLFTAPTLGFVPAAGNPQMQRYGELLAGITQYTATTSDHLPALANLTLGGSVAADDDPEAGPVALLAAAPNPFRAGTRLRFRLDAPGEVRLDVFDALGRRVALLSGTFGAGEHPVPLDGAGLAPGTYVVRLAAAGVVRTRMIVRAE